MKTEIGCVEVYVMARNGIVIRLQPIREFPCPRDEYSPRQIYSIVKLVYLDFTPLLPHARYTPTPNTPELFPRKILIPHEISG